MILKNHLEFLDDFYELDTNRVKLIKGCYKTQFIKNKHIIIIAVSESELINKIKDDGYPKYRGEQLYDWLINKNIKNLEEMSNLPKDFKKYLFISNS